MGTESTEPCGQGLLIGQTFEAISTGGLDSILLQVCSGTAVQVALRAGAAVGEALEFRRAHRRGRPDPASIGHAGDCLTSANGFSYYAPQVFTFTGVAIEAGNTYTIELLQGVAASGCSLFALHGRSGLWHGRNRRRCRSGLRGLQLRG